MKSITSWFLNVFLSVVAHKKMYRRKCFIDTCSVVEETGREM